MKDFRNWWYYHKWYVILCALLMFFAIRWVGGALGLFEKKPDLQIAYAGSPLPKDTVDAAVDLFTSVAGDYNGDGEVIVKLNLYSQNPSPASDDDYYYQYASEVELIGDITDCESYLFLMEDPADLQKRFQILALPDGSEPAAEDFSVEDKCFLWADCPVLAAKDAGTYTDNVLLDTVSGSNQELLGKMYLGRRFFHDDRTVENLPECEALWNTLSLSAGMDARASETEKQTAEENTEDKTEEAAQEKAGTDVPAAEAKETVTDPGEASSQAAPSAENGASASVGPFRAPEAFRGFTLLDNKDILAASGLYYATWTAGSPIPYQNADGENVDLYDAQLYFLIQEGETQESALSALEGWLSAARAGYVDPEETEETIAGRKYTVLTYGCDPETSPFDHGISAFSLEENFAICIELTCRKSFTEDLEPVLYDFLASLAFIDEPQ